MLSVLCLSNYLFQDQLLPSLYVPLVSLIKAFRGNTSLLEIDFNFSYEKMIEIRPSDSQALQKLPHNKNLLAFYPSNIGAFFIPHIASSKNQKDFELNVNSRYNWMRICILIASIRANLASAITFSILSLVPSIIQFEFANQGNINIFFEEEEKNMQITQ